MEAVPCQLVKPKAKHHHWTLKFCLSVTFIIALVMGTLILTRLFYGKGLLLEKFTSLVVIYRAGMRPPVELNSSINTDRLNISKDEDDDDSNVAVRYWEHWQAIEQTKWHKMHNVTYCDRVRLTDPLQVRHHNLVWQVYETQVQLVNYAESMPFRPWPFSARQPPVIHIRLTIYLLNAYYDNRMVNAPVVRILTANMQESYSKQAQWWCLLWFDNLKPPILVPAEYFQMWPPAWFQTVQSRDLFPQLITCSVPKEYADQVPRAVSLQAHGHCEQVETEPSNVLRVKYNNQNQRTAVKSSKSSIGVCVQAFRFGTYDISVRLVEWLEMVRLMGAEKVYFYEYSITDNMRKVLTHYRKEGLVDWQRLTLPGTQANIKSLYNLWAYQQYYHFWPVELIELNDCLYRNLYRHDFLAVLDIDEMIVPQEKANWPELIDSVESALTDKEKVEFTYYSNVHSRICERMVETEYERVSADVKYRMAIPDWLYMMQHTYRGQEDPLTNNQKSFVRTSQVKTLHNHFPTSCINTTGHYTCSGIIFEPSSSLLMHYRRAFANASNNPICDIHDQSVWRYFDALEKTVHTQLSHIFV